MFLRFVTLFLLLPATATAAKLEARCRAAPSFDLDLMIEGAVCHLNGDSGRVEETEGSRLCIVSDIEWITLTPDLIFRYTPPDGRPTILGRCFEKKDG